jgi:hypothetical protein
MLEALFNEFMPMRVTGSGFGATKRTPRNTSGGALRYTH